MKRLRSTTIIPGDLYVERSADRQVSQIVADMGRPGYVLVARQMGKTNLLLNARRRLESDNIIFSYNDLSTEFETLSDFYEAIASNIFEVIESKLKQKLASDLITDLPEHSHKTFELFLRSLLQTYTGKLVIILDEVDSLAGYTFGARIFSHIRSLYFAGRANYPEFERVTFLLSGVAEPTDLIRDKNVSPFNIGEKIYLKDFTEGEFLQFVERSRLNLTHDVVMEIYALACGNPRMSWDICSKIEDGVLQGDEIDPTYVRQVVQSLYLNDFNTAPVNDIRKQVQSDRELRQSLLQLRSGAISEITDRARSRLYLAGIISSPDQNADVKLKNPIIDAALSTKWLEETNKSVRGMLSIAREHYEEARYELASASYEEYLTEGSIASDSLDAYRLAYSYFNIRKYHKAIEWFEIYLSVKNLSNDVRASVAHYLGVSLAANNQIDKALSRFRESISFGTGSSVYGSSASMLASFLVLEMRSEVMIQEARDLSASALAWSNEAQVSDLVRKDVRVRARTNLALIFANAGRAEDALDTYRAALTEAVGVSKTFILLNMVPLIADAADQTASIDALHADLKEQIIRDRHEFVLDFSRAVILPSLVVLRTHNQIDAYNEIIDFVLNKSLTAATTKIQVINEIWTYAYSQRHKEASVFLRDVVSIADLGPGDFVIHLNATRYLCIINNAKEYSDAFLSDFSKIDDAALIDLSDYLAFASILAIDDGKRFYRIEPRTLKLLDKLYELSDRELRYNFAFLRRFKIQHYVASGDVGSVLREAELIRETLTSQDQPPSYLLNDEVRKTLLVFADRYLGVQALKSNPIHSQKIGRNQKVRVKYPGGRVVEGKFKMFERDLNSNKCSLVATLI